MHPINTLIQCQATFACFRLIMPSQSILWQCAESDNPISHRHSTKIRNYKVIGCWSKKSCTDMEIMRSCDCGAEFHWSCFLSGQNRPGADRILQRFNFWIQISFDDTSIPYLLQESSGCFCCPTDVTRLESLEIWSQDIEFRIEVVASSQFCANAYGSYFIIYACASYYTYYNYR